MSSQRVAAGVARSKQRGARQPKDTSNRTVSVFELEQRIAEQLDRLSAAMMARVGAAEPVVEPASAAATAVVQERIRRLGQLAAGLALLRCESLPTMRADYGSTVLVEDLLTLRRQQYTLMVGPLVAIDAAEVSLGSPIGQALLGRKAGDVVEIALPNRSARVRIVGIATLSDVVDQLEASR